MPILKDMECWWPKWPEPSPISSSCHHYISSPTMMSASKLSVKDSNKSLAWAKHWVHVWVQTLQVLQFWNSVSFPPSFALVKLDRYFDDNELLLDCLYWKLFRPLVPLNIFFCGHEFWNSIKTIKTSDLEWGKITSEEDWNWWQNFQ